jgi:two-component system response regulator AtoC
MLAQSTPVIRGSKEPAVEIGLRNSPQPPKKSPVRVLVVDDEPLVRWSVSETLAKEGYEISEAGDGASAIESFSHPGHADVVLLDLRLPDADDLHVLSAMRQLSPRTPVILMTAFESPQLLADARKLGVFAVLDKPFEMDALAPLVEHALDYRPS